MTNNATPPDSLAPARRRPTTDASAKGTQRQRRLIESALGLDDSCTEFGCLARTMAQATLPHSDPKLPPGTLYTRNTGQLTLTVAPTSLLYGIPFGSIPRVILAWICTEAKLTNSPVLSLGRSQAAFMRQLGLPSGGRSIALFREQAMRLFGAVIAIAYTDRKHADSSLRFLISDQSHVFWNARCPEQTTLWDSTLSLSDGFFREIMAAPVPIKLPVLHALSKSPFAMDIYVWLTYRMFVLAHSRRTSVIIPWPHLHAQFGTGYPPTDKGIRNFRTNFLLRANEVYPFYPEAQKHVTATTEGLLLTPAPPHIKDRR